MPPNEPSAGATGLARPPKQEAMGAAAPKGRRGSDWGFRSMSMAFDRYGRRMKRGYREKTSPEGDDEGDAPFGAGCGHYYCDEKDASCCGCKRDCFGVFPCPEPMINLSSTTGQITAILELVAVIVIIVLSMRDGGLFGSTTPEAVAARAAEDAMYGPRYLREAGATASGVAGGPWFFT